MSRSPSKSLMAGVIMTLSIIFIIVSVIVAFGTLASIPDVMLTPVANSQDAPSWAADIEAKVAQTDPADGEQLFKQYGCVSCHGIPNGAGPYVQGLGQRAATRRPGYSAAAYIYESITQPNTYIVKDYPASVMPQNFKTLIPEDQLDKLIAWLLNQ